MKVLIVGSGGREHALAWKISQSPSAPQIYCAPGNPGMASLGTCVDISPSDISALQNFASRTEIDLTIVGPELPLTLGIADGFHASGLRVFGPEKSAARLEGSKIFAKTLMREAGIPTAAFSCFTDPESAKQYVTEKNAPQVVKADGLAAGKGVFPCRSVEAALNAIDRIMVRGEFGEAGGAIVVEDFLEGEEASFICLTDGHAVVPLPSSQDHKAVFDNDQGPNTGGMGAYSPAPVITSRMHDTVMETVMMPLVNALARRGIRYKGVVYAGLMISNNTAQVLEFNVRFGDPETQPILFRLKSDLLDLLNAVVDETLSDAILEIDPRPSICVVMASGGYPGSYQKGLPISGMGQLCNLTDTFVFQAGTASQDGTLVTNGGRVLGVTSRDTSLSGAISAAYEAAGKIFWEGVHYRNDIGQKALKR